MHECPQCGNTTLRTIDAKPKRGHNRGVQQELRMKCANGHEIAVLAPMDAKK